MASEIWTGQPALIQAVRPRPPSPCPAAPLRGAPRVSFPDKDPETHVPAPARGEGG